MDMQTLPADLRRAVDFHGHLCPGLLIGYRAVKALQARMNIDRAEDEELVAIVENDSCSVDAFQALLSTTLGKGNLRWLDHGKQAFTLHDRQGGRAVRALFVGDKLRKSLPDGSMDRQGFIQALLTAPEDALFALREVDAPPPAEAVIERSQPCDACGEMTQPSRTVSIDQRRLCRACAAKEGQPS